VMLPLVSSDVIVLPSILMLSTWIAADEIDRAEAVPSPSSTVRSVASTPAFELLTCSKSLYVEAIELPVNVAILLSYAGQSRRLC